MECYLHDHTSISRSALGGSDSQQNHNWAILCGCED